MKRLVPASLTTAIAILPLALVPSTVLTTRVDAQVYYRPAAYQCRDGRIQFGYGASGEAISVSDCSIARASRQSADFIYYLDNDRIHAQAKCTTPKRHWYTFGDRLNPDGQPVYPSSQAATRMLNYVCDVAGF